MSEIFILVTFFSLLASETCSSSFSQGMLNEGDKRKIYMPKTKSLHYLCILSLLKHFG